MSNSESGVRKTVKRISSSSGNFSQSARDLPPRVSFFAYSYFYVSRDEENQWQVALPDPLYL